ncbi:hypothetical protein TNCV_1596721 [Trichonephila clavipes]|nr:hypothetical protein TNCV_1596721 [Trichonephila clavipes]
MATGSYMTPIYSRSQSEVLGDLHIVTCHNYALQRTAMHILETLQQVIFSEGVQKPRHDSLDVMNIVNIDNTRFSHP